MPVTIRTLRPRHASWCEHTPSDVRIAKAQVAKRHAIAWLRQGAYHAMQPPARLPWILEVTIHATKTAFA